MGSLLAQTVPLSIGAAISPLVLMSVLALLGGQHGKTRAAAFAVGFVVMATALLIAAAFAIAALHNRHGGPIASPAVDIAVGVLLIAFGLLMVRPKRPHDDVRAQEHHRRWIKPDAPLVMFAAFGAILMLVNVSTLVLLVAVLKDIGRADPSTGEEIVALGIADLCTILPVVGPLAAAVLGGAALSGRVTQLGQWTNRNGKYVLCVLFVVFGLQDLLKGLGH